MAGLWYRLGQLLGVSEDDLDIIERNYPRDANMCKIKMFAEWLRGDTNPTYEKLVRALATVGRITLAESVCHAQGIKSFDVATYHFEGHTPCLIYRHFTISSGCYRCYESAL